MSATLPFIPKREPSLFNTYGQSSDVLQRWKDRIVSESHIDLPIQVNRLAFGPTTGALAPLDKEGKPTNQRYGYTWHAFRQLFERAGYKNCPRGSAADYAFWAAYPQLADTYNHVMSRGYSTKVVTLRLAIDPQDVGSTRYTRAVVSDRHSADAGDDAELVRELSKAFAAGILHSFKDGQSTVFRDPGALTRAWFESSAQLAANTRLTVSLVNSEVALASVRASWALTFHIRLDESPDAQAIRVDLPVRRATMYSRHVGRAIARQISFLGDSAKRIMSYTPVALDQLLSTTPPLADTMLDRCVRSLVSETVTQGAALERVNARYLVIQNAMGGPTALAMVVLLASYGLTEEAQDIIRTVCGECMP